MDLDAQTAEMFVPPLYVLSCTCVQTMSPVCWTKLTFSVTESTEIIGSNNQGPFAEVKNDMSEVNKYKTGVVFSYCTNVTMVSSSYILYN